LPLDARWTMTQQLARFRKNLEYPQRSKLALTAFVCPVAARSAVRSNNRPTSGLTCSNTWRISATLG
jgi:hypothetical protein